MRERRREEGRGGANTRVRDEWGHGLDGWGGGYELCFLYYFLKSLRV